ncbi:MAG: hypothetical protein NWQ07_09885 [Flaviramulus sp.]|nr:hypothetical protein [Flaviramulus sp.]
MKINFYILLLLLLSFSLGNAQSTIKTVEVEVTNTISVSNVDTKTINANHVEVNKVIETETLLITPNDLRETIARGNSDIRIYLIRKRNEGNISLVFQSINKAVKA